LIEIEFLTRESTNPDLYSLLYAKFFNLIYKIPFAVYRKKPGNVVFRSRQNLNGEIFENAKQITYPPKELVTEYGRANFPHEPIFYGCIPDQGTKNEKSIDAYNACILETDKELLSDISGDFKKVYTVGKWDVTESQTNFVYLPFSHKAFLKNAMIKDIANRFAECMYHLYPREEVEEIIIPFQKYVSFKFSASKTNKNDYILTNAFKNALLNQNVHGNKLDGIIYSSSMTDCDAINVALTPQFVDDFLKLNKIVMRSCDGVEKHRAIDNLTDIMDVNDNGEFKVVL
jgi:hypothetical protein